MRRLFCAALLALGLSMPAIAGSDMATLAGVWAGPPTGCADYSIAAGHPKTAAVQLAQGSCRGACSSRRGYCMSTCRDSQCRAICNDLYQSCLSSCR